MKKFYITTPIYYINDVATIGHAYTNIIADVLARWHRLKKEDVFFLTGTDENSQITVKAARKKLGENIGRREIQDYSDDMAKNWEKTWKILNISNDGFIRTTNPKHKKVVNEFFMKVYKKGDIYKGQYKGLYCESCEAFYTEKDLKKGECPLHKKPPKEISEENYFFKLSKYQDRILKHIEKNPRFIQPKHKRKEVISFLKEEGARDISISRPTTEWGIPLPIDKSHCFWTWFDALLNYISGAPKYWPASLHLLAKDILRFHCIIWIGMLQSAGYPLPKQVFVHGFLTINGQKMSKSLGNAINPLHLKEKYGNDSLRYFLLREIPFGEDGDFSEESLIARHNNELANDLGNLVSRILTIAEKNFPKGLKKSPIDKKLFSKLNIKKIDSYMGNFELNNALGEIWKFINECNKHINQEKPWELKGKELKKHIYSLLESLRIISILLYPFIPETSGKIFSQLNQKPGSLKDAKPGLVKIYKVKKEGILFSKIEGKMPRPERIESNLDKIDIKEFNKLKLRVARIKAVSDHPDAEKLYILVLDLGKGEHELQIVSGLKENYKKEELINKKVVVITNLKHAVIRGIESQGMLLAAVFKNKVSLVKPDKDIEIGAKVM